MTKLKAQCGSEARPDPEPRTTPSGLPSPSLGDTYNHHHNFSAAPSACSPDVEMTTSSSSAPSPSFTPIPSRAHHHQPSISPALPPLDPQQQSRHNSYSSATSDYRLSSNNSGYATSSATTSPYFSGYPDAAGRHSFSGYVGSALTSPALPPQRDLDQEATAALLMLNQVDRRRGSGGGSGGTGPVRGMSVRDLLSG